MDGTLLPRQSSGIHRLGYIFCHVTLLWGCAGASLLPAGGASGRQNLLNGLGFLISMGLPQAMRFTGS